MASDAERAAVIRKGLVGLQSYLTQYGDEEAQSAALDDAIAAADARIQRELHLTFPTTVIKSWPEAGVTYDLEEEPYDYHALQFMYLGFLQLRRRPVVSVERVRLMFGQANKILLYPTEWIRLNKRAGQIQIVPTPGAGWQGMVLQTGRYFLPHISGGWLVDVVPQVIAVDYTAGIGGAAGYEESADPLHVDLRQQRARLAAREILLDLSNTMEPGVGSKSISEDGASESMSYTRSGSVLFGNQIDRIEADWERFKQSYRDSNIGVLMTVV